MKKTILILFAIILSSNLFAQEQPEYVFSQIVGTSKFLSRKITIEIDFGQKMKFFADNRLKDEKTGRPKVFNSMIDALNYMGSKGWEFAQAYVINTENQNVYHYLMKKSFIKLDTESQTEFMKSQ